MYLFTLVKYILVADCRRCTTCRCDLSRMQVQLPTWSNELRAQMVYSRIGGDGALALRVGCGVSTRLGRSQGFRSKQGFFNCQDVSVNSDFRLKLGVMPCESSAIWFQHRRIFHWCTDSSFRLALRALYVCAVAESYWTTRQVKPNNKSEE